MGIKVLLKINTIPKLKKFDTNFSQCYQKVRFGFSIRNLLRSFTSLFYSTKIKNDEIRFR